MLICYSNFRHRNKKRQNIIWLISLQRYCNHYKNPLYILYNIGQFSNLLDKLSKMCLFCVEISFVQSNIYFPIYWRLFHTYKTLQFALKLNFLKDWKAYRHVQEEKNYWKNSITCLMFCPLYW